MLKKELKLNNPKKKEKELPENQENPENPESLESQENKRMHQKEMKEREVPEKVKIDYYSFIISEKFSDNPS